MAIKHTVVADHLNIGRSTAFRITNKGQVPLKPAPSRPFNPNGAPVRNSSFGGNPQSIIRR